MKPIEQAKFMLSLFKKTSIQELVLAEIIKRNGYTTTQLVESVPAELDISESQFRKTLSELYKIGVVQKVGVSIQVTFNILS